MLLATHLEKVEYVPEGRRIEVRVAYACQVQERYELLHTRCHAAGRKLSTGVSTGGRYRSKMQSVIRIDAFRKSSTRSGFDLDLLSFHIDMVLAIAVARGQKHP
jgi:hypothetical protein